MFAYQITVNGNVVAIAGVRQGVVSAIANWVSSPSELAANPQEDWSAGFSISGLDALTSEQLKWFRRDLHVGDEISVKLIETDHVDEPIEREPADQNDPA